jgi:hypothetical protein
MQMASATTTAAAMMNMHQPLRELQSLLLFGHPETGDPHAEYVQRCMQTDPAKALMNMVNGGRLHNTLESPRTSSAIRRQLSKRHGLRMDLRGDALTVKAFQVLLDLVGNLSAKLDRFAGKMVLKAHRRKPLLLMKKARQSFQSAQASMCAITSSQIEEIRRSRLLRFQALSSSSSSSSSSASAAKPKQSN